MLLAFLLDADNTLIDNDAAKATIDERIIGSLGDKVRSTFWRIYEETRLERGLVDYPTTLARLHAELRGLSDDVDAIVWELPYERFRYPASLAVIAELRRSGLPVVLSDGDDVYQPMKIARAGITAAVHGHVLVVRHKEEHLDEVAARFPADRYVLVDDKPALLAAVKARWHDRVVTVHVRQGHYAAESPETPPDVSLASIADVPRALADLTWLTGIR